MTEVGQGVQVVQVLEDHTYRLDEAALGGVLLRPDVRDLPVVVLSVAGAFRRGKSFLLNFFIRYLKSTEKARQDGSWLGDDSGPLKGFSWRGGTKRNTTGILLWSEPFIVSLPSNQKVAVLLMDTQGTFDKESTVRDCSTIFALSTLLSSVQIYNLTTQIQEDDLQHLQLFTEYGEMVKDQKGSRAFQVLQFLIRDWPNSDEYEYGCSGGEIYLKEKLQITENLPQEMKDLRTHIGSCFEKVTCFLMPHPGLKVARSIFDGSMADIEEDFKIQLRELLTSLLGPGKLTPKRINGDLVRAQDLFTYFKTYMSLFNSNQIPSPTTLMEATVEANMLTAVNEARAVYEAGMEAECGLKQPRSLPGYDVQDLHAKYLALARTTFTGKKKMGTEAEANSYLEKLTQDLEENCPIYLQINVAKTQEAMKQAKQAYEREIAGVNAGEPLCLHPADLAALHRLACDTATKIFDNSRTYKLLDRVDKDREDLLEYFKSRDTELRALNEQNNKAVASELRMEYTRRLHEAVAVQPPPAVAALRAEHARALAQALQDFDRKRNRASPYTEEDAFKRDFIQSIETQFVHINDLNSRNIERERQRREEEERWTRELLERQRRREEEERREREIERQRRREEEWRRERERQERERREREERERSKCSIL